MAWCGSWVLGAAKREKVMDKQINPGGWSADSTPSAGWPDFYALMEVEPEAEREEIKRAINRLYTQATLNHDHRNLSKRLYFQTMHETVLPQARRILLDDDARRAYDEQWNLHRHNSEDALPYERFLATLPSGASARPGEATPKSVPGQDEYASIPVVVPTATPISPAQSSRVAEPEVKAWEAQGSAPSTSGASSSALAEDVIEAEVIEAEVVEVEPARKPPKSPADAVHPAVLRASQARAGRTRGAQSDEDWAHILKSGETNAAVQRAASLGSRAIVKAAPEAPPVPQDFPAQIKMPVAIRSARPAGKTGAMAAGAAVLAASLGWGAMRALAPIGTAAPPAPDTQRQVEVAVEQALARKEAPAQSYREVVATSEKSAQNWSYTFQAPPSNWNAKAFNTATWQAGPGGFGTDTPGSGLVGTPWTTPDIWMRRTFNPGSLSKDQIRRLVIRNFHDEDVEVFINGVRAYSSIGFITAYESIAISDAAKAAIVPNAPNVLAVHCHQSQGGQYIDVGIYERNQAKP